MSLVVRSMDAAFSSVAAMLAEQDEEAPDRGVQLSVIVDGNMVLDIAAGPVATIDSLFPVLSVSKGMTGLCIGLLVDSGALSLDARVADYWPEFAASGKARVTVRQLFSHQAGLPAYLGDTAETAVADDSAVAAELAAQSPLWEPGAGFSYHPVTIGTFANELCRRTTGTTIQALYETEIRAPRQIDAYLGAPAKQLGRVRPIPLTVPHLSEKGDLSDLVNGSLSGGFSLDYLANDPRSHAVGHPAAGAVASARGLAELYAASLWNNGNGLLFSAATRLSITRPAVVGLDLASGEARAFASMFQTPTRQRPFAAHGSFGHEGAGGAMAYADPRAGFTFAYVPSADPGEEPVDALSAEIYKVLQSI